MWVKICGISTFMDAQAAAEAGAEALGFVMGGEVLPPEVEPAAQRVRGWLKRLRPALKTFLVTHLLEPSEILELAHYLGVSGVQISEPLEREKLERIRRDFRGEIVKTVVAAGAESFGELRRVEPCCDAVLLDSMAHGYIGGTGQSGDWDLCGRLVSAARRPVWLAGGLTPGNVAQAIAAAMPAGVDVSTGVSCFGADYRRKDRKDAGRIRDFIRIAKGG